MTLDPPRVHVRPIRPGPAKPPERDGWVSVPRPGIGPSPIVDLNYDREVPPWWATYPQDVPK